MSRSSHRSRRRLQVAGVVAGIAATLAVAALTVTAVMMPREQTAPTDKAAAYYSNPPTAAPQAELVTIIGDSYTGGSDMGGNKEANWVALVQKTTANASLANKGIGGTGYATPGDNFAARVAKTAGPKTGVVVFFGSRNDIVNSPESVGAGAASAYAQVRKISPNAKILVIGPAWGGSDLPPQMLPIRNAVKAAAAAAGATFVDPLKERWFLDNPELIGADGVHPTDAGHIFLANTIGPLIQAALSH